MDCARSLMWRVGRSHFLNTPRGQSATLTLAPPLRQTSPWTAPGERLRGVISLVIPLVNPRIQGALLKLPQPGNEGLLQFLLLRVIRQISHFVRIGGEII